jgi:hypothetical protein
MLYKCNTCQVASIIKQMSVIDKSFKIYYDIKGENGENSLKA